MIVNDGPDKRAGERNSKPVGLTLHKEIDVPVALLSERARAEEHDDAKGGQPENGQQKSVDGVALHFGTVAS